MICGQSRPRPAPPVNMTSSKVRPVSSVMMSRCPRATYAAASSIARTQAPRPEATGSPRSNWRNDGLACAQRLAFIRLDKIAITPPEPAGTAAAISSITT
jgi:hypothetical protein